MCSCSISVVINASIRVKARVENKTPGTAGASCLPVSSSKLKANNSSAASIKGAGAWESSWNKTPHGVAICCLVLAGISWGTKTNPGGCHGPGSNKTASKTCWISCDDNARHLVASANSLKDNGTRTIGAVKYVNKSSVSLGLSKSSNVGNVCKCKTSSSVSIRMPTKLDGFPPDGGHRGRLSPTDLAKKPPPKTERNPYILFFFPVFGSTSLSATMRNSRAQGATRI
mmetsp:Transcript_408/g.1416  ORF Transcript_408/g.1416 Transcript_408/m.1416 type:complete len:228 (-) Transcript_408:2947-3630(-)